MKCKAASYVALGFLLGVLLGGPVPTSGASGATTDGLLYVGVVNAGGAHLHVQIDPRIPPNAVEIFYGSNVVIYNVLGATATPGPGVTLTPTRSATPPALTSTPTRTPTPTATPIAIWHATVRKSPRLLVMSQPGGRSQVGAVGYGAVLEIVEERNWWGRIESPVAGWIDLTYCEVTHE